jgi:hypothetical protein
MDLATRIAGDDCAVIVRHGDTQERGIAVENGDASTGLDIPGADSLVG